MAISTYKIFLMQKNTSAWEKLIDIKEFPDLGGEPEIFAWLLAVAAQRADSRRYDCELRLFVTGAARAAGAPARPGRANGSRPTTRPAPVAAP